MGVGRAELVRRPGVPYGQSAARELQSPCHRWSPQGVTVGAAKRTKPEQRGGFTTASTGAERKTQ